jgi:hypothetical protein
MYLKGPGSEKRLQQYWKYFGNRLKTCKDITGRLRESLQRSEGTQTSMLPLGCSQLHHPSTATKNLSTSYLLPYNTLKHSQTLSSNFNCTVTTHKAGKDTLLETNHDKWLWFCKLVFSILPLNFLITFEETPFFIWDARYPNRREVTKVFCRNTLMLPITQPTPNQVRSLKTKHRPPPPTGQDNGLLLKWKTYHSEELRNLHSHD